MRTLVLPLTMLLAACSAPPAVQSEAAQLEGRLSSTTGALRGDAYLFLFDGEEGIGLDSQPRHLSAISDARLASGDSRYVLANVEPDRFLLSAFVDVNRNAELTVDVLAQPGAGDFALDPLEVTLTPGEKRTLDLMVQRRIPRDPPVFRPSAATPSRVVIPDQLGAVVSFTLEANGLGVLSTDGFHVRFVDADQDGRPDDANGDSIPEFEPQLFLRFRPAPGQTLPVNADGRVADVILPLGFNPASFLTELAQDVTREVVVPSLNVFVLPQAQAVWTKGTERTMETLSAIPLGDYELVVLDAVSGFWRVPNSLSTRGGEFASQGVQFRVERGTGLDAGTLMPPVFP